MSTDDLRENLRDELAEAIYGALSGSFGDFGGNHSRRAADALLPIVEAHVVEVREQIAARLDAETDRATAEHARVRLPFEFGLAEAYGVATRIVRGQA